MKYARSTAYALCLCLLIGVFPTVSHAEGLAGKIPAGIEAPNLFGLDGNSSFLKAGKGTVEVPGRRHVIEIDAPGDLDQPNTVYRLTRDVVAAGTAFRIKENHITLDLNGHTVVYGDRPGEDKAIGVHLAGRWTFEDVAVYNGRIVQGDGGYDGADGGTWGSPFGSDACPIQGFALTHVEIAGLDIAYHGENSSGIYLKGEDVRIHHNTIEDRGRGVENRHAGVAVINMPSGQASVHHNLIRGARHNGIRLGKECEVFANEIHVDSDATNSAGIAAGGTIYRNKIVGRGEHPLGFYVAGDIIGDGVELFDNYVEVQSSHGSGEYGSSGSACLRMQWGDNVLIKNNTFILHAKKEGLDNGADSWGRGLFISISEKGRSAVVRDNLIVALSDGQGAKAAGIAVVANNQSRDLVFKNNTVVSGWANVLLADMYGHADGYPQFVDNRFVRVGNWAGYRTIRSEYSSRPSTGMFISSVYENGASADSVDLECAGAGNKDLLFGWHLDLEVTDPAGHPVRAKVLFRDAEGRVVADGETDADGHVRQDLVEYRVCNQASNRVIRMVKAAVGEACSREYLTPHDITVTVGTTSVHRTVHMDGDKVVKVVLNGGEPR